MLWSWRERFFSCSGACGVIIKKQGGIKMLSDVKLFDKAMDFVFKWEGGLCEDANDAGGITKFGVCLRFLKTIKPNASREDIISLTKEDAKDIFYSEFWLRSHCDELPPKVAFALFDSTVNVGNVQAGKFLQRALNDAGANIKVDGIVGDETITACEDLMEKGTHEVDIVEAMIEKRKQFYKNLAAKNPTQQVFLKGWLNRTMSLALATATV